MFRGIIAALFAGVLVTGLTSTTVCAKPMDRSQPEDSFNTLSGESLRGLESRNVSKDSSLPSTAPISERGAISARENINDNSTPVIEIPPITVFGTKVELAGRRASGDSSTRPLPSGYLDLRNIEVSTGGSSLDPEQVVKVQYQLLSPSAR